MTLLDATVHMCRNSNVTVVDGPLQQQGLISLSQDESKRETDTGGGSAASSFHTDPLEIQCLQRIHTIACTTKEFLNHRIAKLSAEGEEEEN